MSLKDILSRAKMDSDGLLVRFSKADGVEIVKALRTIGFKFGNGGAGRGLYSPSWDRQMGEFVLDEFRMNPSMLAYLNELAEETVAMPMPAMVAQLLAGLSLDDAKTMSEYLDNSGHGDILDALNERIEREDPTFFPVAEEKTSSTKIVFKKEKK